MAHIANDRTVLIAQRLRTETFLRHVEQHEAIASTNDRALELAADSMVPLPAIILTERQTAGRGRGANVWRSGPGALTFPLVIERPTGLPTMAAPAMLPVLATWTVTSVVPQSGPPPLVDGRKAWPWLVGGAVLMAVQAVLLTGALAVFGDATAINVVYSARGLWAVAAVMVVGHWFRNEESLLGPAVLRARLCGAAVMTVAIVIAMVR